MSSSFVTAYGPWAVVTGASDGIGRALAECLAERRRHVVLAARRADRLEMMDVNCRAVAASAHTFARHFVERGKGGLVLMSSLVAFQGVPRAANYAATKAWVQSFAEALRLELGPRGVAVVASAPGPVHSAFAGRAAMTMGLAATPRDVAEGTLTALGRVGTTRPGWLAKLLEASLMFLPRVLRVRMMGVVMGGMTRRPTLQPGH